MNLIQIDYFLAVAETLNFTAAAKKRFISQPALSMQIVKLEEELNAKLFIRNNKKVELTEAGAVLREDLLKIVREIDNTRKKIHGMNKPEIDIIKIGCFDGLITTDFLDPFIKFLQKNSTETEIYRYAFNELRNSLKNNQVEMIFTLDFELPEFHGYAFKTVVNRKSALIYSNKHPFFQKQELTISDLAETKILVSDKKISPGGNQAIMDFLREHNLPEDNIIHMENMMTLLSYIELGRGVAVLDRNVVDQRPHVLYSNTLSGICPEVNVVAVYDKNRITNTALLDYIDSLNDKPRL